MPCESMRKPQQTAAERMTEVRMRAATIDRLITTKRVNVKVGPQGAVVFTGITEADRDGLTDACIFRILSRTGSAAARMAIVRAEQTAGRAVDRRTVAQGIHSHDGGTTWHQRG